MFVQLAGAVMARVGVSVIASVGVNVAGTKPTFVGGRVAVIKFDGVGVFTSSTCTEMQADKRSRRRKVIRILFFIRWSMVYCPIQNIIICPLDSSTGSLAICSSNVSRVKIGTSSRLRSKRYFTSLYFFKRVLSDGSRSCL